MLLHLLVYCAMTTVNLFITFINSLRADVIGYSMILDTKQDIITMHDKLLEYIVVNENQWCCDYIQNVIITITNYCICNDYNYDY